MKLMKLRAEQWAMVGVVGIGAFAAYLLTRARPRDLERIDSNERPVYGRRGAASEALVSPPQPLRPPQL